MAKVPDSSAFATGVADAGTECAVVELYAQTWNEGRPDLPAYLRKCVNIKPDDFAALLRLDQRLSWRAGERVPAEEYLRLLAERCPDAEVAVDLIFQEYMLREQLGEQPDAAEFCARFPEHAAVMRAQIELHRAIGAESPGTQLGADVVATAVSAVGVEIPKELRAIKRYEIVRSLGRGSMGSVYLARDTALDRLVALKVPHFGHETLGTIERFRREAKAAAALHHPHLCPVFDVGAVEGIDYLTMPFIAGESLAAHIKRNGQLPASEAVHLIHVVATAMAVAHEAGVIHRDLKPANILLNEKGAPIVTDFGLARRGASTDSTLTEPGTLLGTPAYMPPEHVGCDPATLGPRSDIYSLGVIFYELLTGRLPFIGSTATVLGKVLTEEPEPPSQFSPELDSSIVAVCLQAMAKKPEDRFASMAEFAAALQPYIDGQQPHDPSTSSDVRKSPKAKRKQALVIVAAIVVLVICVLTAKRPGDNDELFRVGQVWAGRFQFLPPAQEFAGAISLTITERNGQQFRGLYQTEDKFQWEAEGEAANGSIGWRLVKPLNPAAQAAHAEQATVTGSYSEKQIEATYVDATSRARISLQLRE